MNGKDAQIDRKCEGCNGMNSYCDEHKAVMIQLEGLKNVPTSVSKMVGILGLIGTLFTLTVGILFNAHFENKKTQEVYSQKFDALSNQITNLESEHNKSISAMKTDILRISITLEQMNSGANKNTDSKK